MECNLQRLERKKKCSVGRRVDRVTCLKQEFWAREMRSVINMVLKKCLGGGDLGPSSPYYRLCKTLNF